MSESTRAERAWLPPVMVAAATLLCFAPALRNELVNFDDVMLLVRNRGYRGLGLTQLHWMFTSFHMGPYQPLSWLTYAIDYSIWGMSAFGFHLTNIVLHAATAVAVYFVSVRLITLATGHPRGANHWAAACAALLFSLHPLRVESVAWATERRDVLSGLLVALTVLAYLRYVESAAGARRWWYVAVFFAFVAACLAKAIAMTLPISLLILDVYPLRRLGGAVGWNTPAASRVWLEKGPLLAVSVAIAGLAIYGQHIEAALSTLEEISVPQRLAIAAYATCFYVWKTIWPSGLAAMYEIPRPFNPRSAEYLVPIVGVVFVTAAVLIGRRRWPASAAVWLIYLVTLAPVSGLSQAGGQIAADRYTYLPCVGFAILAGALLVSSAGGRWIVERRAAAVVLVVAFGVVAVRQIGHWETSQAVFDRAIAVDPKCAVAHFNMSRAFANVGDPAAALPYARRAVQLSPQIHHLLSCGEILTITGHAEEALELYSRAVQLHPKSAALWVERGVALVRIGRGAEATQSFEKALELEPNEPKALAALGNQRAVAGNLDAARADYLRAVETGRLPPDGLVEVAGFLVHDGKADQAVEMLRVAARRFRDNTAINRTLAWTLASHPDPKIRNGDEALRAARIAVAASDEPDAQSYLALAAAYSELGRFDEALEALDRASEAAKRVRAAALVDVITKLQADLAAGRPIRSIP